jgi:hypothetical protein
MYIEFADLVRRDYAHQETLIVIVPLLGVAVVMQMVACVWTMYMTPNEMQRLWPSDQP